MNRLTISIPRFTQFRKLTILLILITSIYQTFVHSVNAQLDSTFGVGGVNVTDVLNSDSPLATFVLPNEKIFILNQSRESGQPDRYYFVRYNSNGTLDATYGVNGIKQLTIPTVAEVSITGAIRQPNGKFLLIGADGVAGFIGRFNEDGTIDTSFGTNGVHRPNINFNANDVLYAVVILPDGKIFGAGANNNDELFFIRYFANGLLDESFNGNGFIIHNVQTPTIKKMFLQSTGKILIFGADGNLKLVKRYNSSDGTVDNSFTNITYTSDSLIERQLLLLPDNKIILASNFEKSESLERKSQDILVSKFTENGGVDINFNSGGTMSFDITTSFDDRVFALASQPDGQLIVGCSTNVQPNRTALEGTMVSLARISATGTLNGKFLLTKSAFSGSGSIDILQNGKILTIFEKFDLNFRSDLLLTRSLGVPLQTYNFKGVPFDFLAIANGYSPDGISDPTIFRPAESRWYMYPVVPEFLYNLFGLSSDIPVPSDYLSDLASELAVFRPGNGTWYIAKSFYNSGQNFMAVQWGVNGDVPAPDDFDNDSKSDIAVFRPSNGVWYIRNSNDNSFKILQWGINGDKPVVGDYDGDSKADVAVWRPSDGVWYILKSSDGQASITYFGLSGDIPVQEDYDGDGKTDVAVWRPSTQVWYVLRSSDGGFSALQWGLPTDYAVPADYDGDKKTDIAVWRPSQGRWYVFRSSDSTLGIVYWGTNGDVVPQRRQ